MTLQMPKDALPPREESAGGDSPPQARAAGNGGFSVTQGQSGARDEGAGEQYDPTVEPEGSRTRLLSWEEAAGQGRLCGGAEDRRRQADVCPSVLCRQQEVQRACLLRPSSLVIPWKG